MESNTFFPIFTAPPISDPRLCGAAQRSARRPQLFRMGALDGAFGMFEDKPYTGLWAAASCGDPRRARLRFKAGGDDLAHIDALARRFSPIEI